MHMQEGDDIWTKFLDKILTNLTWHRTFKFFITQWFNEVRHTLAGWFFWKLKGKS